MSNIYFNQNTNRTFEPVMTDNKGKTSSVPKEDNSILHNLNTLENDTYERLKQKKRRTNSIIAISGTATLATVIFIAAITGKSQKVSQKIQHLFGGVESKFANVKDRHLHKILTTTFGVFDRFGKIITNSSPIKDWALYQALGQTKITTKIRDSISKFYTKENYTSVDKSLKKARESYNEFTAIVEKSIQQSENNPSLIKDAEGFAELKNKMREAKNTPDFLLPSTFEENYALMQKDMDFLSKEISFKRLFSKEALQGFVPQSILLERRGKYAKGLIDKKNNISSSFKEMSEYAQDKLDDTNILIYSIKDPKLQKKLRDCSLKLNDSLKKYVKDAPDKKTRDPNWGLIQNNVKNFKAEVNILAPTDIKDKLMMHIDEYENLFANHKPGVIQDIRVLAGQVWGDKSEFDLNIKKKATVHSKDLNLALNRTINMFDKERDIVLGSGPADVLGLLSPVAIFGWTLYKDDSKDKKIGTSLELGIPIVGGMLVYLRTLALQYNGVKALATSAGVGVLLNLAGGLVYKKYMANQELAKQKEREGESTPQRL